VAPLSHTTCNWGSIYEIRDVGPVVAMSHSTRDWPGLLLGLVVFIPVAFLLTNNTLNDPRWLEQETHLNSLPATNLDPRLCVLMDDFGKLASSPPNAHWSTMILSQPRYCPQSLSVSDYRDFHSLQCDYPNSNAIWCLASDGEVVKKVCSLQLHMDRFN